MNKNVLIVLIGGFVVAILVAVLVQASLGGQKEETNGEQTYVLVATKDLPIGAEISAGDLKWQSWPGSAFKGAIVRKDDQKAEDALKGKMIQRVSAGQPVLQSYIYKEGKGNLVAATLAPGMRAVAIPVKAYTMAGGFVAPGDFVDVILTYKISIQRDEKTEEVAAYIRKHVSETILKNIKVLAVDQESSREDDDAKIAKTVTLAVKSEEAEKLALASEMGDLTLALRGIGDDDMKINAEAITTDVELSGAMKSMMRLKPSTESSKAIRIYSGPVMQEVNPRGVIKPVSATDGEAPPPETEEDFDEIEDPAAQVLEMMQQIYGVGGN
jgi:pilus assembly protein CpaB